MEKEEKLFGSLFGKAIKDIRVNKDNSVVAFITDTATHYYFAEADCCSQSWFESFDSSKYVISQNNNPRIIVDAVFLTCNCPAASTKQECDIVYHVVLTVNNYRWTSNITVFNLRNSSNGYYCGSICYLGDSLEKANWAIKNPEKVVFRSVVQ